MADPDGVGGGQIGPDLDSVAEITYTLANSAAEFKTPGELHHRHQVGHQPVSWRRVL